VGENDRSDTVSSGCALSAMSLERSPDVLDEAAAVLPLPKSPDMLVLRLALSAKKDSLGRYERK